MTRDSVSYLIDLLCPVCGLHYPADSLQTFCRPCSSPLLARYDLDRARAELDRAELSARPRGMWRWRELLPVRDAAHIVTLGEGDCPLLPVPRLGQALGLSQLYVKDESFNPTGSFKARGMAAAVSRARELGVRELVVLATDAALSRSYLSRLAVRSQDALAACIRPTHTRFDGDIVFAVACGPIEGDVETLSEAAFGATAAAVERAVRAAAE